MSIDISGQQAKKSLGQNFLTDQNVARKIVALVEIGPEDCVLEIGPGPGSLSQWLAQSPAAFVAALEKDAYWVGELKKKFPQVGAIHGDCLEFAWEALGKKRSWKLVGNLPYNVASPFIWEWCSRSRGWTRAVFMVQKEVGQRLVAKPGSKTYGALSVWVQTFTRARMGFVVGPEVFRPRPKVHSAVLIFTPGDTEYAHSGALSALLRQCFQQRRKQLRNILKNHWSDALARWFENNGLSPTDRPESLTPEQFQSLAPLIFSV